MTNAGRPTSSRLDEAFAKRIIEARTRRGMTQEDLARRLKVSRRTVVYWECGQLGGISVQRVEQIAKACVCDPRTLAYGKKNAKSS